MMSVKLVPGMVVALTVLTICSAQTQGTAVNSSATFTADTLSGGTTIPNRSAATALKLTDQQRAIIRAAIDNRPSDVDFPLGTAQAAANFKPSIGSKVPTSLKGQTLPIELGERIPALREYLYLKLPDQAVLVDPMTRKVADIISLP